jgi:hypothetical protein
MEKIEYIEPLSKKQLAMLMNISDSTMRNYLNNVWYDDLNNRGYDKTNKVLSPRQIKFIESRWGKLNFALLSSK